MRMDQFSPPTAAISKLHSAIVLTISRGIGKALSVSCRLSLI